MRKAGCRHYCLLIILSFALVLVSGCVQNNQPVACTKEAKLCPDGSSVERTGPNCEFEECPESKTDQVVPDRNQSEEPDPCGNGIGNGYEIIPGPSGHEGDYNIDNPFMSLTVHPTSPDIVLIGTERNGFVKSIDGGKTWVRLRKGLWHDEYMEGAPADVQLGYPEIYDIAYSESNPDIIYAAATGGPGPLYGSYPISDSGVYKSTDGGNTWRKKNCGLSSAWIWSIWVSPDDPDIALVGISGGKTSGWIGDIKQGQYYGGGIFRTTDGGNNWEKVHISDNDTKNGFRVITSVKNDPSVVYTSGVDIEDNMDDIGLAKSTDGGVTWKTVSPELKELDVQYFDVSSDGSVIYAQAEDPMEIMKSVDGGETWSAHSRDSSGYVISVSPGDPDRVLFATAYGVSLSTDGLGSFSEVITIESRDGTNHIGDIVFSPSDNDIVYVIQSGKYDLYKSTDAGETFSKIISIRDEVLNVIP